MKWNIAKQNGIMKNDMEQYEVMKVMKSDMA
jgi:hypothetical protein